jgi:hypothetical protein
MCVGVSVLIYMSSFYFNIGFEKSKKSSQSSVRLYLQFFVGVLMSYLRYLCLFVYIHNIHNLFIENDLNQAM